MLRILKITSLITILRVSPLAGQTGTAMTSFATTPVKTVNTDQFLRYSLDISADIPQTLIKGKGYDINFGEIKLQIHEVDANDVTNIEDTSNQILITESNIKPFFKGTSILIFDMKAPTIATKALSNNRKYRVRLVNTKIAKVATSLSALELNVLGANTLSTEDINQSALYVYPNPVLDHITMSMPVKKIILHDMNGRFILETKASSFSVKHLLSGIYVMSVEAINGTLTNYKVVKK